MRITLGWLLAAGLTLLPACASRDAGEESPPGSGVAEYRQITDAAIKAIQDTVSALDAVAAESDRCSPEVLNRLSANLQRLQVESLQVRSRTQAILARGDAYFAHWQETLARVKDPEMRTLAEQRRPQLQETFNHIKAASQQAGHTFKPFLSGVRALRNSLERDPASLGSGATQELLAKSRTQGGELLDHLSKIRKELDSMDALLSPYRRGLTGNKIS